MRVTNVRGRVANVWENGGKRWTDKGVGRGVGTISKVVNRNIRRVAKGLR